MWFEKFTKSIFYNYRDPLDDDTADVLPWECSSREVVYGSASRRRQDSAADSGSSSSDVSACVVSERARRLPQQSTLDGGLRGAPPPLRRLSAVEPRHLAPLASPPHSPRPPRPAPPPAPRAIVPPPHPTPTISVSSAPDDESTYSPPGTGSPERSLAHSDEPSSVFASADATPTEPMRPVCMLGEERSAPFPEGLEPKPPDPGCDSSQEEAPHETATIRSVLESVVCAPSVESYDDSSASGAVSDSKDSDRTKSSEDDVVSVHQRVLSRESSTIKETSPASSRDTSSKIGDLPENTFEGEDAITTSVREAELKSARESEPTQGAERVSPEACCSLAAPAAPVPAAPGARVPVAPLAVCEDIGVDDDNVDKVPSAPLQRVSEDSRAASDGDATKHIAHKDELTSVSETNIVKRDSKSGIVERKQRNDICPWEDE